MFKYVTYFFDAIGRQFSSFMTKIMGKSAQTFFKALYESAKWVILILLFIAYEWALYYFNDALALHRFLPELNPAFRPYYAPFLGFLVLLAGIILYYSFVSWDDESDESPFPDIEKVWNEAMDAVESAGILPHRVSLFLVLGRPESPELNMFEGGGYKWVVKYPANDPNAPIHVYAEKESSSKAPYPGAIYVTCRGASVLGKLAGVLARDESVLPTTGGAAVESSSMDALNTVGAVDRDAIRAREIVAASQGREATVLEKRKAHRAERGRPLGSDLLADTSEVTRLKNRLAYLCQLIGRERGSECAMNGIMLLIPLGGTDTIGEAKLTAQACIEDLTTVRRETKIDCPIISMLVDMENLPGFPEFLSLQRSKELTSRRGGSFPMSTRLPREELRQQLKTSLAWTCTTYLQDSVYSVFQSETDAAKDAAPLFPRNSRLALLLTEMNERTEAVCDIVLSAVMPEKEEVFRYSGFYFAATGPVGMQGFIAGVFQKLVKEQASVTWTQAALDADEEAYANASYYATFTYILVFLLMVTVGGFSYYRYFRT